MLDLGAATLVIEAHGSTAFIPAEAGVRQIRTTGDIIVRGLNLALAGTEARIAAQSITFLLSGGVGRGRDMAALNRDIAFAATGGLTLSGRIVSAGQIALSGGSAGAASNLDLEIRAGSVRVGADLDAGSADLTIVSSGQMAFVSTGVVALKGDNVEVASDVVSPESEAGLSITALGDLRVGSILVGGALTLEAGADATGTGDISFVSDRATVLRGSAITLTSDGSAPVASNQALFVSTAGDLAINANLATGIGVMDLAGQDLTGTATLTSTGDKTFTEGGSGTTCTAASSTYTCN